jgi:hypothetical protein
LTGGLVLIAIGAIFLLGELRLVDAYDLLRWWPMVLVVLGLGRVLSAESWARTKSGLTLLLVGGWASLVTFRVWLFHWGNSWPILLIGFGLLAVYEAATGKSDDSCSSPRRDASEAIPPVPPAAGFGDQGGSAFAATAAYPPPPSSPQSGGGHAG